MSTFDNIEPVPLAECPPDVRATVAGLNRLGVFPSVYRFSRAPAGPLSLPGTSKLTQGLTAEAVALLAAEAESYRTSARNWEWLAARTHDPDMRAVYEERARILRVAAGDRLS